MRSLFVVFAIAACGPMNRNGGGSSGDGSGSEKVEMVCHDVQDTGSLMAHSECQPRNHKPTTDDQKNTELLLGKPRSQPTKGN